MSRLALGLALGLAVGLTVSPGPRSAAATSSSGRPDCPSLPPPAGRVVRVAPADADRLPAVIAAAAPGTTILLADGTYPLAGRELAFRVPRVTLRSASGQRETVVLDGQAYRAGNLVAVEAPDVTIADLTLRQANYHPIHVRGGGDRVLLYNLHVVDGREQLVKVNPSPVGAQNDYGTLACSLLELTAAGRARIEANPTPGFHCYTGGLNAHQARGWVVRDNVFRGIYCPHTGLALSAIHFWRTSRDTVVERNRILNSARGIGFGLGLDRAYRDYPDVPPAGFSGGVQHVGGIIRDNVIWSDIADRFDTGIILEQALDADVQHNTVYADSGFSAIDARFPFSNPRVRDNLTNLAITVRHGARPAITRNRVTATSDLFVDAACGDLRLAAGASRSLAASENDPPGAAQAVAAPEPDTCPDVAASGRIIRR